MKTSERINTLHQQFQEIETFNDFYAFDKIGVNLDYMLLYTLLEDAREFYETEGD